MERVQITGGGNGVYADTKGRTLYTMGDYSPAVGEWVWTNGTTIYGHQLTGGGDFIFISENSILPLTAHNYTTYSNMLYEILKDGSAKPLLENFRLLGYVGNKRYAYGYLMGSDYHGNWYNLKTGENLGSFSPEDACISDAGDLLTLEYASASYDNTNANPSIKKWLKPHVLFNGKRLYQNLWSTPRVDLSGHEIEYGGFLRIRRNGKIIKEISFDGYMNRLKAKANAMIAKAHTATNDSANLEKAIEYPYEISRPRPNGYIFLASVSLAEAKIYPDGTFTGYITASSTGYAFPWFVHKITPLQLNPYANNSKIDQTKAELWVKDWVFAEIHIGFHEGLGRLEGYRTGTESTSISCGMLMGPLLDKSPKENAKPQNFITLEGFSMTGVLYDDPRPLVYTLDDTSRYLEIYLLGTGAYGGIDVYYYNDREWTNWPRSLQDDFDLDPVFRNNGGTSTEWHSSAQGAKPAVYEMADGYTAKFSTVGGETITVFEPDGTKVFSHSLTALSNLWLLSWNFIHIHKIRTGCYIVIPDNYYIPVLITNGKVEPLSEIGPTMNIFSATPYRKRKKLLKSIQAIVGDGNK